jgi:hypothetical protein
MNKVCSKCNRELPVGAFSVRKTGKLRSSCKQCEAAAVAEYRKTEQGKQKVQEYQQSDRGKETRKAAQANYNKTPNRKITMNRYLESEKGIQKRAEYAQSPEGKAIRDKVVQDFRKTDKYKAIVNRHKQTQLYKDTTAAYNKSDKRKQSALEYHRRRRQQAGEKLNDAIKTGIYKGLKHNKNGHKWESLVGYTLQDLMVHLEMQFQPGMTWDNYGEWHVDHRIPKAAFTFTNPCDSSFLICWGLDNLQPMWASENMSKRDKIIEPVQSSLIFTPLDKNT